MSILRGVVGEVQEEADVVHGSIFLKVRLEEASSFHVNLKHQVQKVFGENVPSTRSTIQSSSLKITGFKGQCAGNNGKVVDHFHPGPK